MPLTQQQCTWCWYENFNQYSSSNYIINAHIQYIMYIPMDNTYLSSKWQGRTCRCVLANVHILLPFLFVLVAIGRLHIKLILHPTFFLTNVHSCLESWCIFLKIALLYLGVKMMPNYYTACSFCFWNKFVAEPNSLYLNDVILENRLLFTWSWYHSGLALDQF